MGQKMDFLSDIGTDAHLGQMQICDRCTFGTEAHLGQMHIWDRYQFDHFLGSSSRNRLGRHPKMFQNLSYIKLKPHAKFHHNRFCGFLEEREQETSGLLPKL